MRTPPIVVPTPSLPLLAADTRATGAGAHTGASRALTSAAAPLPRPRDRASDHLDAAITNLRSTGKRKRYVAEDRTLLGTKGFTEGQIARMFKKGGKLAIRVLCDDGNLGKLTHDDEGKPLFSREQIVGIASRGGAQHALALLCNADKLGQLRATFSKKQIVHMASQESAGEVLDVVADADSLAKLAAFAIADIVKIASRKCARKLLEFLCTPGQLGELKVECSHDDIVRMASKSGARGTLEFLCEQDKVGLLTAAKFSDNQIVGIASHDSARKALDFLCKTGTLGQLNATFSIPQIARIASNTGAAQALDFLCKTVKVATLRATFSKEQIVTIACNTGATQALNLLCNPGALKQLTNRFSDDQIVCMGGKIGARNTLDVLCKPGNLDRLIPFFSETQIVRMSSRGGASQSLKFLLEADKQATLEATFSADQIADMVSEGATMRVLDFLCKAGTLARLGDLFSAEQIVVIASRHKSEATLAAILGTPWRTVLKQEELFSLVCVHSGALKLSWFLRYWPALSEKGVLKSDALRTARRSEQYKKKYLKNLPALPPPKRSAVAGPGGAAAATMMPELGPRSLQARRRQPVAPADAGGQGPAMAVTAQAPSASRERSPSQLLDALLADDSDSDVSPDGTDTRTVTSAAGTSDPALDRMLADESGSDSDRELSPYPFHGPGPNRADVARDLVDFFG